MNCRFTDLRHKEVISACDGTRIDLIGEDTVIISCQTPKPVKKPKKPRFGAKF